MNKRTTASPRRGTREVNAYKMKLQFIPQTKPRSPLFCWPINNATWLGPFVVYIHDDWTQRIRNDVCVCLFGITVTKWRLKMVFALFVRDQIQILYSQRAPHTHAQPLRHRPTSIILPRTSTPPWPWRCTIPNHTQGREQEMDVDPIRMSSTTTTKSNTRKLTLT